jgi:hypothetical protein
VYEEVITRVKLINQRRIINIVMQLCADIRLEQVNMSNRYLCAQGLFSVLRLIRDMWIIA